MPPTASSSPPGQPEYKVYRSRKGLLSRFRSARPLQPARARQARREGGRAARREPEPAGAEARAARWRAGPEVGRDRRRRLDPDQLLAFMVSAQLQSMKLADKADDALHGNPFLLASPQTILVIGTDARPPGDQGAGRRDLGEVLRAAGARRGAARRLLAGPVPRRHADARPGRRRRPSASSRSPATASPRSPARAPQKINGAYAFGGAALQIETVEKFLGIDIDHVVIIDFRASRTSSTRSAASRSTSRTSSAPTSPAAPAAARAGSPCGSEGRAHPRRPAGAGLRAGPQAERLPGPGKSAFSLGYNDLDRAKAQQEVLNGIKGRLTDPLRLPYNFIKGPIIGWDGAEGVRQRHGRLHDAAARPLAGGRRQRRHRRPLRRRQLGLRRRPAAAASRCPTRCSAQRRRQVPQRLARCELAAAVRLDSAAWSSRAVDGLELRASTPEARPSRARADSESLSELRLAAVGAPPSHSTSTRSRSCRSPSP